jgi:hypothetical protein
MIISSGIPAGGVVTEFDISAYLDGKLLVFTRAKVTLEEGIIVYACL